MDVPISSSSSGIRKFAAEIITGGPVEVGPEVLTSALISKTTTLLNGTDDPQDSRRETVIGSKTISQLSKVIENPVAAGQDAIVGAVESKIGPPLGNLPTSTLGIGRSASTQGISEVGDGPGRDAFQGTVMSKAVPILGHLAENPMDVGRGALMAAMASEATPLLTKLGNPLDVVGGDPDDAEDVKVIIMAWQEFRYIASLAIYSLVSQIFEQSIAIAPVVSLGHLSLEALAATTLGTLIVNITGFSVLGGLAGALDTILPAAYASGNKKLVGLWCQRMALVLLASTAPIMMIWNNAHHIFVALNQDPEVSQLAATYLRWYSLGLPAYAFNLISRRYLETQGLYSVQSTIVGYTGSVNIFMNYALVYGPESLNLGFIGAPLASVLSYWIITIGSLYYAIFRIPRDTWALPWEKEVRKEVFAIRPYVMLFRRGVAGIAYSASKNWAQDIVSLAVSLLGPIALSSQAVLTSMASLFSQISVGLSTVSSQRIERLLQNTKPKRARIGMFMTLGVALGASYFIMTIIMAFKETLPQIFTPNPQVGHMVIETLPVLGLLHIADSLVQITGGILRGTGDERFLSLVNVSGFYTIGLPLGLYLAFRPFTSSTPGPGPDPGSVLVQFDMDFARGDDAGPWGLYGLWVGNLAAVTYSALLGVMVCLRTNWNEAVDKARERGAERDGWVIGTGYRKRSDEIEGGHEPGGREGQDGVTLQESGYSPH